MLDKHSANVNYAIPLQNICHMFWEHSNSTHNNNYTELRRQLLYTLCKDNLHTCMYSTLYYNLSTSIGCS